MADIFNLFNNSNGPKRERGPAGTGKTHRSRGTPLTRVLISLAVTLIFAFIYFYIKLPALNIHAGEFYWYVFWTCLVFCAAMTLLSGFRAEKPTGYVAYARKSLAVPFYIVAAIAAVVVIGWLSGLVVFRAGTYSRLITVEKGDFASEVAEISFDQIPRIDEASANNLANRKLGELSDLVSQFTVSADSAQINYNGRPVRVAYLDYGSIFKWFNNRKSGIPAYMIVDMATQDVSVVRLEESIKYSPSEYLGRDLDRYLRFQYPTKMFAEVKFEINEDGTPYWVASVMKKTIGLFDGQDIAGAVLVNAINGETEYFDVADIPTWVDRVFPSSLIIQQYDFYGKYQGGFLNALFGQKNCTESSSGYNYIVQYDGIWLYTGITSVSDDRGNIGFILVNQRTKEARYYACAGAEEYSAMSSAEGAVQQYSYTSTFPLLLNISDQPTYFMALKDEAGLVKMYAMVNVEQYQIVATGTTVENCRDNYSAMLLSNSIVSNDGADPESFGKDEAEGEIEDIRSASIDGNTYYFIKLSGDATYYTISAKEYPIAVILNKGDRVAIVYEPGDETILIGLSIRLV